MEGRGRKGGKVYDKEIKMCYVYVSPSHKKCKQCVLQTWTKEKGMETKRWMEKKEEKEKEFKCFNQMCQVLIKFPK